MARKSRPERRLPLGLQPADVLADYRLAYLSRQVSLIGRREVLSGKAKFGIFGDGKEIAQIALARSFKKGDWRSGYYRDQTLMFALGVCTPKQFFAQLYADADIDRDPMSGGRQMNAHFATRYLEGDGSWKNQLATANVAADLSPTAAQMGRLVGLGYASKLYREIQELAAEKQFSDRGREVAFGMIGNASAAEGIFWESLNAAAVLQIPMAISVWDDGFGISVPNRYQMCKESVSKAAQGFQREGSLHGMDIYVVPGWDYPLLVETYAKAVEKVRTEHVPALIHVTELTQPQGHSTSGSHERYKTPERLAFEKDQDGLTLMRDWLLELKLTTEADLARLEQELQAEAEKARDEALKESLLPIQAERDHLVDILETLAPKVAPLADGSHPLDQTLSQLRRAPSLQRRTVAQAARRAALLARHLARDEKQPLADFIKNYQAANRDRYSRWMMSESHRSPLHIQPMPAEYSDQPVQIPGNEIIQKCFDHLMARDPRVFIIGEDVGVLGDVNQNFKGLQEKFGVSRITDTGIREATILGQGIGAAMRGLRPVVDIQYLDYLLYCFQLLSDDVATLHYRSAGGQIAPVIVRTKGHRLEGIWHSGSPMGTIIHGLRGMHVCVPRNMVQAAGMYNTLFQGDDPALVIEVLSGYRLREALPENLSSFTVALGMPDIVVPGEDITIVTYGACVRIAQEAVPFLHHLGIHPEVIDVQTLLPFDISHKIAASIRKTNAVLFLDEDVPGGASAFMMQQVLEDQKAYEELDGQPRTLTAMAHRSAYGSDGDYWCKPSVEDVIETVYDMMRERRPDTFPCLTGDKQ